MTMTIVSWIGVGIAIVLLIIFIILKSYVKRKTDEYDGLWGFIIKKNGSKTKENNSESDDIS